ncbi:sushi, von Willebrand factor type A, EGF and pentraxin domain-containing protein 1-like isoform X2 [Gigantopelta aegis]|uniref:sushi, von Willebrand factor type A, EGF and pentraxin domain-containing protein 1-like isoform X2 n=1 Tax=Gigantopelta aegis TaxID=1735272 RepID=UPI001B888A1D|nr:sushi, von Willebrand factor type A, EGF and pentraxin domain-containing protein 1-like isoform X2 [Gigantopelta aegis]
MSVNSTTRYSCNVGYVVFNGSTTSTCDVTGTWTPSNLTCVEISCGQPPDVPNANKTTDGMSVNSLTRYSCNVGYVVFNGSTTSMCDVMGMWTPSNLTCVVDCGPPVLFDPNGVLLYESTILGSNATVECDFYFRFFGNSSSAKCDSTGKWVGVSGACLQVLWELEVDPFMADIPEPIQDGWEMVWDGIPGQMNTHFTLNFKRGVDKILHMDTRFNNSKVIFNTYVNGVWGTLVTATSFPFESLVPFELRVQVHSNTFKVFKAVRQRNTLSRLRPAATRRRHSTGLHHRQRGH